MQANPRPAVRKASKFVDVKIMIAALSAAVTVGFWNLFSGQAVAQSGAEAEPQPDGASMQQQTGLLPVPTLVPLVDVSVVTTQSGEAAPAQAGQAAPLRSVEAPSQVVVQKNKPLIDSPAVVVVGGSSSRSPRPAATTRSSR